MKRSERTKEKKGRRGGLSFCNAGNRRQQAAILYFAIYIKMSEIEVDFSEFRWCNANVLDELEQTTEIVEVLGTRL